MCIRDSLYTCRENLDFALTKDTFGPDETLKEKAAEARTKFCTAMDADLNTPDALAAVFDLVKEINTLSAASSKACLLYTSVRHRGPPPCPAPRSARTGRRPRRSQSRPR